MLARWTERSARLGMASPSSPVDPVQFTQELSSELPGAVSEEPREAQAPAAPAAGVQLNAVPDGEGSESTLLSLLLMAMRPVALPVAAAPPSDPTPETP